MSRIHPRDGLAIWFWGAVLAAVCWLIWAVLFRPAPARAAVTLPHYRIEISFDLAGHRLFGSVAATLPARGQNLLVGKGLRLTELFLNDKSIRLEIKGGHIRLPSHPAGSRLHLRYEASFPPARQAAAPNSIAEQGVFLLGDWYPALEDAPLSYFSLSARIPRGFQAVSEADAISVEKKGAERLVAFDFPHPLPAVHFVMAPYVLARERCRKIEVETYLLPGDQSLARPYLDHSKGFLQMYEKMLGPYPYRRFAVVENIQPSGYGLPTFTLLGQQVLRLPFIPKTSLGHEILHSWFGNSVYVDSACGDWAEALTTYLADHYYKEQRGQGWLYRKNLIEDYESYVHQDNEIALDQFSGDGDRARRAVGYGKGAMVFHMLERRIGAEAFYRALRLLVRERLFQLTSWEDLERLFSRASGEDLRGFWGFWLEKRGAMDLDLDQVRLHQPGKGFKLQFRLSLQPGPLPLSVPIQILARAGAEKRRVTLSSRKQSFTLTMKEAPRQIVVDPDYDLFRHLKAAERRQLFSRLLGDPTRTMVLPESGGDIYQSLIRQLRSRGFSSMAAGDVAPASLSQRGFLFLGAAAAPSFLFAPEKETAVGFRLQVKRNPFNPKKVIARVLARDAAEVKAVAQKLFHYGQYSSLKFSGGRNLEKDVPEADRGICSQVPAPVSGIAVEAVQPLPKLVRRVSNRAIVYVGEKHNRYGDHLMQLEVIRLLYRRHPRLAIGMEMFQRRYQKAMDAYIRGAIAERTFLRQSHYFTTWRFNYNLYRPILRYARRHKIPVIALNQDNELVSKVARQGLASLSPEERLRLPTEMNFDDRAYERRLRRVFQMHRTELPGIDAFQVFEYFHQAQILWDETMAESIAGFMAGHRDYNLVVLAGNGHLAYGSGIPKRAYRRNGKDHAIILPNPEEPLEPGLADFIVFPAEIQAPEEPKLGVMLETSGGQLKVAGFSHGSGAKAAGLCKGDVIVAAAGEEVKNLDDLKALVVTRRAGDRVALRVRRGAREIKVEVELTTLANSHF